MGFLMRRLGIRFVSDLFNNVLNRGKASVNMQPARRHVIFVTDPFSTHLLTSFRQWREKTAFIVSPNLSNDPIFKGIDVYKPDELTPEMLGDYPIALFDDDKSLLPPQLSDFFAENKNRVVTLRQWVIEMLEDPSVQISPERVRLDICTRCQLNCASCYMRTDKRETTGIGHVTPSQFETFLIRNPNVRTIEISNSGEPFIHPQLHEILEIADKYDVTLECTNGANFNYVTDQVLEDLVRYRFKTIHIAIDGASQETYSIYRRNGNFDKVIANIRKLNEIKKRMKSERPELVWQFIVMSHNYDDIPRAKELAKELGMGIGFKETWDSKERNKLKIMLAERKTERDEGDSDNARVPANKKIPSNYWCRSLLAYPQINWDGRLLGCCVVYRSDWGVNVFDKGLVETLNTDLYRKTFLALLKGEAPPYRRSPCYSCKLRPPTPEEAEGVVTWRIPPVVDNN